MLLSITLGLGSPTQEEVLFTSKYYDIQVRHTVTISGLEVANC